MKVGKAKTKSRNPAKAERALLKVLDAERLARTTKKVARHAKQKLKDARKAYRLAKKAARQARKEVRLAAKVLNVSRKKIRRTAMQKTAFPVLKTRPKRISRPPQPPSNHFLVRFPAAAP